MFEILISKNAGLSDGQYPCHIHTRVTPYQRRRFRNLAIPDFHGSSAEMFPAKNDEMRGGRKSILEHDLLQWDFFLHQFASNLECHLLLHPFIRSDSKTSLKLFTERLYPISQISRKFFCGSHVHVIRYYRFREIRIISDERIIKSNTFVIGIKMFEDQIDFLCLYKIDMTARKTILMVMDQILYNTPHFLFDLYLIPTV